MKEVAILIPNYNSYEAIQLCVESVRKHTEYPYQMIVYDSKSTNGCDLGYLRKAKEDGWIELIEADTFSAHGTALNFLLNERCKSEFDYAVVMDDDTYIKEGGWLEDMLSEVEKEGALASCDYRKDWHYYHTDIYEIWFSIFNLKAYRDGMQVDWLPSYGDLREEPWKSMKEGMVPLEPAFFQTVHDVGAKLVVKMLTENPKKYKVVPLPEEVRENISIGGRCQLAL